MTTSIPQLIDIVKTKYMDNPAVLAVADSLVNSQNMVRALSHSMFKSDGLAGYERACVADKHEDGAGYYPLNHISADLFTNEFKRANAMLETGILMRTLVIVLQRLGEEIDY